MRYAGTRLGLLATNSIEIELECSKIVPRPVILLHLRAKKTTQAVAGLAPANSKTDSSVAPHRPSKVPNDRTQIDNHRRAS